VALEISVTVNVRELEGSNKREPFSETTQTCCVRNGAVIA